ncbi:DNA polymerase III subunit delta' [Boudabousia liubingyangii]|nr:DNA polymerase III subunit delta' [Boudabousia liubingyangii]
MTVWEGLIGQRSAAEELARAAQGARYRLKAAWGEELTGAQEDAQRAMTHAWLVTGPPGSGRSNAALAFAAALQCESDPVGCGQCEQCRSVLEGRHRDVQHLATDKVIISIDDVRQMVMQAQSAPGNGRWRVMIIEDADRMLTATTNTLLKAIEEPPERTVWILSTPSVQDVLPTIRSRCRLVSLVVPPAELVAQQLVKEGRAQDQEVALEAALAAQSHIGRARMLLEPDKAEYRKSLRARLSQLVQVDSVGQALQMAAQIHQHAKEQSDEFLSGQAIEEINALRKALGGEEGGKDTPALKSQIKEKEADNKRRAARILRDELDSTMLDCLGFYRDVLTVQTGSQVPLVNQDLTALVNQSAQESTTELTLLRMDAIAQARRRINANVAPLSALEAMVVSFLPPFKGGEVFI